MVYDGTGAPEAESVEVVSPKLPGNAVVGVGGAVKSLRLVGSTALPLDAHTRLYELQDWETVWALERTGNAAGIAVMITRRKTAIVLDEFFILYLLIYLVLYLRENSVELVRSSLIESDHEAHRIVVRFGERLENVPLVNKER